MMLNKGTFTLNYGHCNTPGVMWLQMFGSLPITWRDAPAICLSSRQPGPPAYTKMSWPRRAPLDFWPTKHILNETCLENGARQTQEESSASDRLDVSVAGEKCQCSMGFFAYAAELGNKLSPPRSGGPGSRLRLLRLWKDLHMLVGCGVAEVHSSFLLHWRTLYKLWTVCIRIPRASPIPELFTWDFVCLTTCKID